MGIINLTPDSFHADSRSQESSAALKHAEKHLKEGAQILDLGAYSSRPGASDIIVNEELNRLIKPLKAIRKTYPNSIISVDTFRSEVAKAALEEGADMINDISGGTLDKNMLNLVADYKVPYIMMHMKGNPQTMQKNPKYENVVQEINQFFERQIQKARAAGINDIILDPGIGFGKSLEHNYQILKNIERFTIFGLPVLLGISRKSVINKILNISSKHALNGTTTLHSKMLDKINMIYRVHDVKEMAEAIHLSAYFNKVDA